MELEWDEEKRRQTLQHRGLDFADVERFDPNTIVTLPDLRSDYGEARFNSYGYLDDILCCFCWTPRNERIRIISLRKMNDRERKIYERQRGVEGGASDP